MGEFYGITPGTIPGFAEAGGGRFISVADLPGHTVRNMAMFMDNLRGMHEDNPLASYLDDLAPDSAGAASGSA
jgi:hypothetical protein